MATVIHKADEYLASLLGADNNEQANKNTNDKGQESIAEENIRIALDDEEL